MRIVFMGNGPFAEPALVALAGSKHELVLVVARPDRPQGKHQTIEPGPIARRSQELKLPLEQPENVNDSNYVRRLAELRADLFVVADFGQILSAECLAASKLGGINIHASLLPKYRGAAPIAWAIYHGETQTGVSLLAMTPKMDAGGIVARETIPIGPDQTTAELEPILAEVGAKLIVATVNALEQGPLSPEPQDPAKVTKAPKLKKEDGRIRWDRTAQQIHDQFRAFTPWPGVFFEFHSANKPMRVRVEKLSLVDTVSKGEPGVALDSPPGTLHVQTLLGKISIDIVQPAGKNVMPVADFLRGRPMPPGTRLDLHGL